jgi:hypothetical protein
MSETAWTKWTGGLCPVPSGAVVEFRRRSGEVVKGVDRARDFYWGRYLDHQPTDIVAYRVLHSPLREE